VNAKDEQAALFALKEQRRLIEENKRLREACKEAFLFVTAPLNSPRLWPTSRGNLTKMLEKALEEEPSDNPKETKP
jgi:hypothetical protein